MNVQHETHGGVSVCTIEKVFARTKQFGIDTAHSQQTCDPLENAWIVIDDKYEVSLCHDFAPQELTRIAARFLEESFAAVTLIRL